MSYVRPSVLVYEDLANSGGASTATPDLEAVIIGPCYQVLTYTPGSLTSQIATAALSASSTTGTITSGEYALTVASTALFSAGDSVLVAGAGTSGANLQANITNISGNVITLDSPAGTTISSSSPAAVTKSGKISNPTIANAFNLPGQQAGQLVDASSIQPWVDNVKVETLVTGVSGYVAGNTISITPLTTTLTGTVAAAASSATFVSVVGLTVGDSVAITGAGTSGATLTALVTGITGSVVNFTPATVTSTTGAVVSKVIPSNVNSLTNTLKAEVGNEVVLTYKNTSSVVKSFTSQVLTLTTTSGVNGLVNSMTINDMLPADFSYQTTGGITTGTNALTVASASGLTVGGQVIVRGAGVAGADLVSNVTAITGLNITLADSAGTTVAAAVVVVYNQASMSVRKVYDDQVIPATKPISGGSNYDTSNAGTAGVVTINSGSELAYGKILQGNVYFAYRALRTDLCGTVQSYDNMEDITGSVGDVTDNNPFGLALSLAKANTTTRVRGITVPSNDLAGYVSALSVSEGERLYALAPLTQDIAILNAFKSHAVQMSTAVNASWRATLVNTAIPSIKNVGQYSSGFVNSNASNAVSLMAGNYVLTSTNSTFISDGVVAGDTVNVTAATPTSAIGTLKILSVVSNQQIVVQASAPISGISFYISRALTKTQSATAVASASTTFGSGRVWHIQPDVVGVSVSGVTKYLPGYYLCAAVAGLVAGSAVQQGFTNIGIAGITDLKHSNFYFSKADLNAMAGAGTMIYVQDSQGGTPYCRHELTTDVSVLEYREVVCVKNWDFLSYFYYDKLKAFIGSWNITPDSINTVRRTLVASSELLKAQKQPKIGAPLLSYKINSLVQDSNNKDNLNAYMSVSIVYPMNYVNLHLVI